MPTQKRETFTIISRCCCCCFFFVFEPIPLICINKNELLNLIKGKKPATKKMRAYTLAIFLTERNFDVICVLMILPRCYLKRPCKVECVFFSFIFLLYWNRRYQFEREQKKCGNSVGDRYDCLSVQFRFFFSSVCVCEPNRWLF